MSSLFVKFPANSAQEGSEPTNCNVSCSSRHKNDGNYESNGVLEMDEQIMTHLNKRPKMAVQLDLPHTDLETIKEADPSLHGLPLRTSSSSDQPVACESVGPCCFNSMSGKGEIAEYGISVEGLQIRTGELLDDSLHFRNTSTKYEEEVLIHKSNGNTNENHNVDMHILRLPEENQYEAENDVVPDLVSAETDMGSIPRVASCDACRRDPPLHFGNKEQYFLVSNDAPTMPSLPKEIPCKVENDMVLDVVSAKIDTGEIPRVATGDACEKDLPLRFGNKEQSSLVFKDAPTIPMLPDRDMVLDVVWAETDNGEIPRVVSGDACSRGLPLHLGNEGQCALASKNASSTHGSTCDADMLANNILDEIHSDAKITVGDVGVHNVDSAEENAVQLLRTSSSGASSWDTPPQSREQIVASDSYPSVTQLNSLKGAASQVANESVNVVVDRAFAGCTWKKLLVLDLNGVLFSFSPYIPYECDFDVIISRKGVYKRSHCDDFLRFCFERFHVGVWTSKTKRNIEEILDVIFGENKRKLLFCWDQSHCTNTGFYTVEKRYKPLLLKKLKKLWDKFEPDLPWERGAFNESNTLLIDDSPYKAIYNPLYTAIFPYTYRFRDFGDNSLGPGGDLRVYLEGLAMAENVQEYVKQNPFGQRPITEKNLSWGFYRRVIEASATPPRQTEDES